MRAPLDGVAFGVNNLALALGDTGIRVDWSGGRRVNWHGRYAPHAVGVVGAATLDAKPSAVAPIRAPRVPSVPELGAVWSNAPSCEGDDVVDTGLTVIGDDSSAIPVLKGIRVDAAADRTTSENFLRRDGEVMIEM